jgi:DnaJ-domain-containing protein 1
VKEPRDEQDLAPAITCWFCGHASTVRQLLRDGILRSREASAGGPYRLLVCPACGQENLCEKTARGRWFASPSSKLTLMEYLFSKILDRESASAQTLLAAISWLRDNEDRRRYFFERDGDRRYSGASLLGRLWPGAPRQPAGSERHDAGAKRRASRERGGSTERDSSRPRRPSPIVTPHEVLGLEADASEQEIRAAFHRLAIHYHPDKVHHRGEEFERIAQEKFLRLKEAYEILIRERGSET